jgi:HK97 family phage major capsid protein
LNDLKILQDLIESKKQLLAVEEDAEKQKALTDEILELTKQEGKLEAEKLWHAKEREEAKTKTAMNTIATAEPKVKVTQQGEYRGYNLKAEIAGLQIHKGIPEATRNRFIADPVKAEHMCKMWLDLYERAFQNPHQRFKAAMQEGTTTEGGFLVFDEYRAEVLSYIREVSIALQDCRVIPMNTDVMRIPAENAKVSVALTAEESDATESEPTFAEVTLTAKRVDAFAIASNELMNDTGIPGGIVAILMSQFNEAIGQYIDSTVFQGTGDPVSGLFLSTGYSEVFSSGSTHFSELLESNIRNVIKNINPSRRGGAKWYSSTSVLWQYVRGLKDSNGNYLFYDGRGGGGAPGMLWGYPVREGNDTIMKSTSAADTGELVFGNLLGFIIGERMGTIDMLVDPYSKGKSYQTQFYIFTRWAFAHALANYYARIVTAAS